MESPLSFSSFNFHPVILKSVARAGYQEPTPIQVKAISHIAHKKDVLGLAQTGTGKTAAFALPIINNLMERRGNGNPRVLVIVPTRELADQVTAAFHSLSHGARLRSIAIYGGVAYGRQLRDIDHGADVVVACPGRLLDHLERGTIDLSAVEVLVLDEADQMFDMGFLPTIRKIIKALPKERQNLLFSATMPAAIRHLMLEVLKDPIKVEVGTGNAAITVKHAFYPVAPQDKIRILHKLLGSMDAESVLVFARTKHRVKKLALDLEKSGHKATSLQGNLSQSQRSSAMHGFRTGKYQIMVATDIAARGIDISTVSHVVNFDAPDTVEAYIHRIGRTGRAARSGDAFTLITNEDREMVRAIEQRLKMKVERRKFEGFVSSEKPEVAPAPESRNHNRQHQDRRDERHDRRDEKPRHFQRRRRPRHNGPSRRSESRR